MLARGSVCRAKPALPAFASPTPPAAKQTGFGRAGGSMADGEARNEREPPDRIGVIDSLAPAHRQVREKHVFHGIDKANPRAEITVEPLQAQQHDLLGADEPFADQFNPAGVAF